MKERFLMGDKILIISSCLSLALRNDIVQMLSYVFDVPLRYVLGMLYRENRLVADLFQERQERFF